VYYETAFSKIMEGSQIIARVATTLTIRQGIFAAYYNEGIDTKDMSTFHIKQD
jgi:hypothetical protein